MIKWMLGLLAVGCLLATAGPAGAEIMDSADFDWKYDMDNDLKPSETDLGPPIGTPDGTMDFTEAITGGSSSVLNEVLTIVGGSKTIAFNSSAAGELWPLETFSHERGYTLEIRMKIAPTASEGSMGLCMVGAGVVDPAADGVWGYIKKAGMGWYNGSAYVALDTTDNNADGEWHTFRFAQEPNPDGTVGDELFSVWRDNVLVNGGIDGGHVLTNATTFGDRASTGQTGTFEVDYFRFTDGAYAPIPEPSTLILLAGGLLSLVLWRRR
jgi:hypothetical protein